MNRIPMKLDYSKTLNDQHETFEYYKNRYISYELQITQLNKRIAYLERSIERKDDTIIELRNENCFCNRTDCSSRIKDSKTYDSLEQKVKSQQQAFIEYLEDEKDRLASEVSHTYEDDLGKTGLINEDIFNEVNRIKTKYKEIIGGNNVFR